ncbi:agrin-like [Rhopilema esculentum]|uniref:agrin-like n=1 Tax=Rhopilema esculentum TaxID=499914 RepID=UPI0031D2FA58
MQLLLACAFCFASVSHVVGMFFSSGIQSTKCVNSCPAGEEMVCGSDGKTYLTSCHLRKESCEKKQDIKVEHPGSCDCPKSCQKNYKPVCATDTSTKKEKTYPNICQYKKTACQMKKLNKNLVFNKRGPCKRMSKCPAGCQDIFAPVCGADNKTYSSVCSLKLASCNKNKKISLIKIGRCKPGECPENCPLIYRPICGNDGKLYPSECELKLTACRTNSVIKRLKGKKAKRICGKKCVAFCPEDESPVCGTDAITYGNECKLFKKNCEKGKKVRVVKRAKCDHLPNKTVIKK